MAAAFNVPFANGGAWPFHNMHLQAGLANGGWWSTTRWPCEMLQAIFDDLPVPEQGWLTLPETPGLGFEPDRERCGSWRSSRPRTARARG